MPEYILYECKGPYVNGKHGDKVNLKVFIQKKKNYMILCDDMTFQNIFKAEAKTMYL